MAEPGERHRELERCLGRGGARATRAGMPGDEGVRARVRQGVAPGVQGGTGQRLEKWYACICAHVNDSARTARPARSFFDQVRRQMTRQPMEPWAPTSAPR